MKQKIKNSIRKLFDSLGYHLECSRLIQGSDEPFSILAKVLEKSTIGSIVDGGASIGDTSMKLSKLFPHAQVYAFEPYPPFIESLKEKAKVNARIKIEPFALDETEGKRTMIINESEGTNSFFTAETTGHQPYGDLMRKKGEFEVTSKTLDKWASLKKLDSIDIIKLDLQGNELSALRGAKLQMQNNKVKAILSEVSFISQYKSQPLAPQLMKMLNDYGFDLFNIYQIHYHHGQMIQADALFLNRSLSSTVEETTKSFFLPHSKLIR